jgi:hypothetical protein
VLCWARGVRDEGLGLSCALRCLYDETGRPVRRAECSLARKNTSSHELNGEGVSGCIPIGTSLRTASTLLALPSIDCTHATTLPPLPSHGKPPILLSS